ncbi:MAG: hypothetical protein MUC59_11905, partial [Saprospiraceae bacterium]|nr:hypothetical protein [Saprospiraceae bacterium]
AERTIEILHLGDRDALHKACRNAFANYKARLFEYVHSKANGTSNEILENMKNGIRGEQHPSVWYEMKRYYRNGWLGNISRELHDSFAAALGDGVMDW